MAYRYVNPNPLANHTGDCTVRAASIATGNTWDRTYDEMAELGRQMGVMPDKAPVWGAYLRRHGFKRAIIPNTCPDCYTVREFALEHPYGTYVLAIDGNPGHVVAINGEVIPTSTMIVTPAATEELQNVSTQVYVPIPRGCCQSISVRNTSDQPIEVQNANLTIFRPDLVR